MIERRFEIEVGRLVAGSIERDVRSACFREGFECDIDKSMGLLAGSLFVRVRGDDVTRLDEFMGRMYAALKAWESRR